MSSTGTVQDRNRELAVQINEEALRNPQSPYAHKFVGIANGQVVVVADNANEMSRRLREIEPDPSNCFGVEASRDYDAVEEIWELRRCRACSGEARQSPSRKRLSMNLSRNRRVRPAKSVRVTVNPLVFRASFRPPGFFQIRRLTWMEPKSKMVVGASARRPGIRNRERLDPISPLYPWVAMSG